MSPKKTTSSNSGKTSGTTTTTTAQTPQFIMDEVKFLLGDVSTPESAVEFDSQPKINPTSQRATPATIQNSINPPVATWTWVDQTARLAQTAIQDDLGKYGIQTDINSMFQLTSVSPIAVWQPVKAFTNATWTWINVVARNAQPVTSGDVGKVGYQSDIDTYYQLTSATPPVWQQIPNPTSTSSPFELSKGASDADSYHDFFRLQIAFEDVWTELLDNRVKPGGQQLYAMWDALMNPGTGDHKKAFDPLPVDTSGNELDIAGTEQLQAFISNLKILMGISSGGTDGLSTVPTEITLLKNAVVQTLQGCNMLLQELNRAGSNIGAWINGGPRWLTATAGNNDNSQVDDLTAFPGIIRQEVFNTIINGLNAQPSSPNVSSPDVMYPGVAQLLTKLDQMLKETYAFDVFAPSSINYGVLLNYRQRWQPQSYQVGNLVTTIPLAPQETRKYATKSVVKKTRNVKEIDDSLRSGKDESSNTWRVDAEIVDRAKNQTNFQKNASGSYGSDDLYKVSAGMQQGQDQAVESAQTKRDFHESVVKSSQEYRNEHRTEISTEESREDETTSYREIRNPNDELTVTYLFYELQRRYLVDESLYKATPVILVANEIPAPHEVDEAWLLRYDWIIKRTILDDSFLPALEYLSANYTGENLTLQVLGLAVEQQKAVVDRISQQVQLANVSLQTATLGLQSSEDLSIQNQQQAETQKLVKSFFDPLGIGQAGATNDGNTDRARVDFAKDALNRAQAKVDQLTSDLKTEATALQVAIDKYTAAATKHFGMLADIDRLRVHVKDNIIYYMQAIWTYEPADQRYFRLYNLDVPIFAHNTTVPLSKSTGLALVDQIRPTLDLKFPVPKLADGTMKLHQVADLENLIGFKGNYMIFPMTNFNYMTWYLMQNYLHFDDLSGVTAVDPDPLANLTTQDLKTAIDSIQADDPQTFVANQAFFQEAMLRLLSNETAEMVIVPSNSLYIEALPGTHPLLEDFKLIHRAIDIKKAQAEARHAELENLRLAARLANGEYGDPDVEKKIVIQADTKNLTVQADGS